MMLEVESSKGEQFEVPHSTSVYKSDVLFVRRCLRKLLAERPMDCCFSTRNVVMFYEQVLSEVN
jgi:hypothetical protein